MAHDGICALELNGGVVLVQRVANGEKKNIAVQPAYASHFKRERTDGNAAVVRANTEVLAGSAE